MNTTKKQEYEWQNMKRRKSSRLIIFAAQKTVFQSRFFLAFCEIDLVIIERYTGKVKFGTKQ